MTDHTHLSPATSNVFDAAKAIAEVLKSLDKQQQSQAIRFASESLGLHPGAAIPGHVLTSTQLPAASNSETVDAEQHSTDIRTFCEFKAPKTDQQFAAVVAYFYQFEAPESERRELIDAKTLKEAARLVGRSRPPSPGMTLTNAKNAGYLDSLGNGNYRINTVGENLVAVTLPGTGQHPSIQRPKKLKKKAGK